MNIAPNTMHFPSSASSRVRAAFGSALVCTCLLGGGMHPAWAESGGQYSRRDDGFREATRNASRDAQRAQQEQQAQQFQAQSRRAQDNRGADPRAYDARADEQRRNMQSAEPGRRSGRLTPDERRDLRRQINEAGQDIYAAPPRR
jgi:hypothetical protein